MDYLIDFRKVWPIIRGEPYVRFSRTLLLIGAGLAAGPKAWELVLTVAVWALAWLYGGTPTPPDISGGGLVAQLLGVCLCISGIIVFCVYYRPETVGEEASFVESHAWQSLERLWHMQRDLNESPQPANMDDVALGLHAVNESGRILQRVPSLLSRFRSSRRDDFFRIYNRLQTQRYQLPHQMLTTDRLLQREAHQLAKKLG